MKKPIDVEAKSTGELHILRYSTRQLDIGPMNNTVKDKFEIRMFRGQ
jgi:hypothetical protein